MEMLINDLKFGFRSLISRPVFSSIALLTLALGIGVTTAMYTLVNNVLLQPLPFPNAHELVFVGTYNTKKGVENNSASINLYNQFNEVDSPLRSLAFWAFDQVALDKGDKQEPLTMMITSANYLEVYDVKPIMGRWYEQSDINTQAVVISYKIWQEEFNADPEILTRPVTINKQAYSIIGVMPQAYVSSGYSGTDIWMPIDSLNRNVTFLGRLKPDISIEQASQQSAAWQKIINDVRGDTENVMQIKFTSMLDSIVKDSRPALYMLLVAVIAVFLIAVLNVVNLTFAQYANRIQELAVRVSVGATRKRLLQQLLCESAVLCTIGGIFGLLLSAWTLEWIQTLMGTRLPRAIEIEIDIHTIFAILLLITVSTMVTALIPAFTVVNPSKLANAIKQAGRKATGDRNTQRIRRLLVGGEVCVAVILLICAGLLLRSYSMLANQATGFNSDNIVTGHIWMTDNFRPQPTVYGYWLRVVDELSALPNVEAVAATSTMPMSRTGIDYPVNYSYPGAPAVPRGEEPSAFVRSITPAYFSLLEIPVLDGREFDERDTADSPKVVIINETLAKQNWPNEAAVGNILQLPEWMGGNHRVVGVVSKVKHNGLRANSVMEFFLPVTQHHYAGMSFLVKSTENAFNNELSTIKNNMLQTSIKLEPTSPMIILETLEDLTQGSIVRERIVLTILGTFAAMALVLASIGVYGISDNMVSQRTNEIGVRMAIGATPKTIRRWILLDATKPVMIGAVVGLVLAFSLSQFMASILFGVKSWDPLTYISIPLILVVVALVATWLPVRKATRVHPQKALQYE